MVQKTFRPGANAPEERDDLFKRLRIEPSVWEDGLKYAQVRVLSDKEFWMLNSFREFFFRN